MRFVSSVTVALTVAFTAAMYAQEVKSTTKITGDNVKPVSFTGCLQTGTQTSSYVLDKVVPVGQTTKTEATARPARSRRPRPRPTRWFPANESSSRRWSGTRSK
jgi:hypothetical protein